jgi:hypothetical protein
VSLPFAQVPYALLEDRRLTAADKVIGGLILRWLGTRPSGWVLNDLLARDAGVDARSVRRSLRRLETAGWYRCEADPGNRGRRRVTACWREGAGSPAATHPTTKVSGRTVGSSTRGTVGSSKE